jgi:hypothetical protein
MDIGEAVSVLIETPSKCPFCDSKAGPEFKKKEMVNDAVVLAKNAGGMPYKTAANPDAVEHCYIYEKYWKSPETSQIVMSPHHVLPGNASVARCPQVLKWMAGTVSVKKKIQNKTVLEALRAIDKKVASMPESARKRKRVELFEKAFPPKPLKSDPEGLVVYALDEKKPDEHIKPVTDNYVTGEIEFDVNDGPNCIWLPSHCAVANWTEMKGVDAWHQDQDSDKDDPTTTFDVAYAYNTMMETGVQFHDAHPDYSTEAIAQLKKLSVKVQLLGDECLKHPNTKSKKDGPYPAPEQLTAAMYKLASLFKDKLNCQTTKPVSPYFTSKLALEVAALK